MASKIVRTDTYAMLGDERVLRLKKWSTAKLYFLIRLIGEVWEKLVAPLGKIERVADIDLRLLGPVLVAIDDEAKARVTRVIVESVEDPKLTEEQVLDWDPEDYLGVLAKILRLNVTEDLRKNLTSLPGALFPTPR